MLFNNRAIIKDTMNRILYNIFVLTLTGLFAFSCAKVDDMESEAGEGCLVLKYSLSGSITDSRSGDVDKLLEISTLKIYSASSDALLRRYSPATDAPDNIYLVSGEYRATLSVGAKESASFVKKSYYGEALFTIDPNNVAEVEIKCPMINSAVKVVFDQTVINKLDGEYMAYVSTSDIFSKTDAESNNVPTLKYTSTSEGIGYFILPEGVSNFSWGFYGNGAEVGSVAKEGVVLTPKAGYQYTLTFKYSKTPDGFLGLTATVEEHVAEFNDDFIFNLQPTIAGSGFDLTEMNVVGGEAVVFDVAAVRDIKKVQFTIGENIYTPFEEGVEDGSITEGVLYTSNGNLEGQLSLSSAFLNALGGGVYDISISVLDSDDVEGKVIAKAGVPGLFATPTVDLWYNTALFQAIITGPAVTTVDFQYKLSDSEAWVTLSATKDENGIYRAIAMPSWASTTNDADLEIYSFQDNIGIFANKTYDFKVVTDGVDLESKEFITSTSQTIHNGNMEDASASCYTTSNGSSTSWASGNNSTTGGLCLSSTKTGMGGNYCSKLTAVYKNFVVTHALASGNMHLGTFAMSGGTTGVAQFGQPYTWEARPKSLRVKYHATIGRVDYSINPPENPPIKKGDQDISSISVVIMDWTTRHAVSAGLGAPTGVWSPATAKATDEGNIIAYGLLHINETTSGDSMIEVEIPINYYDILTKPNSNYTLTISASTSAYGDYMIGCSSNVMYVDDFEWVY